MVSSWKTRLAAAFSGEGRAAKADEAEAREEKLYSQIGKLKVELDWLKKKSAHFGW